MLGHLYFNYHILKIIQLVCKTLSIFAEYVKVKNYDAAIEPWIKVRENCPDLNAAIYTYGERIIKNNIKNGNADLVESSKKELIKLYDEWIQYFPKNKNKSVIGDVIGKKSPSST